MLTGVATTRRAPVAEPVGDELDEVANARGVKVAKRLAAQLERDRQSAAASLRKGLDDMFTVRRLGTSDRLARSLSCANAIESMISTVRLVSSGVKR